MMKRYRLFSEAGVRDIANYNKHCAETGEATIPQVVIVIDELADLMLVAQGGRGEHMPRRPDGARRRYAPRHCDTASVGGRHNRSYEGEYPVEDRVCRLVRDGEPHNS